MHDSQLTVRLPGSLVRRFTVAAQVDQRSPSDAARVALDDYIEDVLSQNDKTAREASRDAEVRRSEERSLVGAEGR